MSETDGFRVFAAEPGHLAAWREGGVDALARLTACAVADGWPVFPEGLDYTAAQLEAGKVEPPFVSWLGVHDGRLVAEGGAFRLDARTAEFGYGVAPGFRGRGFGLAIARNLFEAVFAVPEIERLLAHTYPAGAVSPEGHAADGSIAVLRKLGFDVTEHGETWRWERLR